MLSSHAKQLPRSPSQHQSPGVQAFVDFDNGAEAERAITTKDRQVFAQKFGDRYVRLVQARHVPNNDSV